jgi:integrase
MQIQLPSVEAEVEAFYSSIRSEVTKKNYAKSFRYIGIDPVQFIEQARKNQKEAEWIILSWILKSRPRLRGYTIRVYIAAVKSLCDFCDVTLNWKKIVKASPKITKSTDREIVSEEISKIFQTGNLRLKFLISIFRSSAIRRGALPSLQVRDLQITDSKIGILRVYRGEQEEYFTFVTPECVELWNQYKDERIREGEEIKDISPLVRISKRENRQLRIRPLTVNSLASIFRDAYDRCGIREREFKSIHGFRKAYKTRLENAGMKSLHIEMNMGHAVGLDSNYYRPATLEERMKEYEKFMEILYISEVPKLKQEMKLKEEKFQENENRYYIQAKKNEEELAKIYELLRLKDELSNVKTSSDRERAKQIAERIKFLLS